MMAAGNAMVLGKDNEVAKRWGELQLEHGRHDFWELEETGFNKYPDSRTGLVQRLPALTCLQGSDTTTAKRAWAPS